MGNDNDTARGDNVRPAQVALRLAVPKAGDRVNAARDREIVILHQTGMPYRHIARRYGISHERVRVVIKLEAGRSA